jgi:hypothetical protein
MNWQRIAAVSVFLMLATTTGCAENQTLVARAACGPGTVAEVPAYNWHNGHLVREGWECRSIYSDG